MDQLGFLDVLLRLGSAAFAGALIGLDRELKDKPAGLRTMSLVSLGSSVFVLAIAGASADASSRVIQGIVTGVGFLGAGTIMRRQQEHEVLGLTTAASIWLSSAIGVACGLAYWPLVMTGTALCLFLLVIAPFEDWLRKRI